MRRLPVLLSTLLALILLAPAAQARPRKRAMKALRHIVIDPGHGGDNRGTPGAHHIYEKRLTLPIALALERLIRRGTDAKVTLTRRRDVAMSLRERTALANTVGGDIFLSIHLNASPNPSAHGLEVYFLSADSASETIAELVAREDSGRGDSARENSRQRAPLAQADTVGSSGGPAPGPNRARTPLSLRQVIEDAKLHGAFEQAETVAGVILDTLHKVLGAPRRGVFQAPFGVLKRAHMPAVVVEVGFLTHPKEGKQLTHRAYQKKVARGLYQALLNLDQRLASH